MTRLIWHEKYAHIYSQLKPHLEAFFVGPTPLVDLELHIGMPRNPQNVIRDSLVNLATSPSGAIYAEVNRVAATRMFVRSPRHIDRSKRSAFLLKRYLLDFGLGSMLSNQGFELAHAASVECDGSSVLFFGNDGSGKTTAARQIAAASKSWSFVSDNYTPISRTQSLPFPGNARTAFIGAVPTYDAVSDIPGILAGKKFTIKALVRTGRNLTASPVDITSTHHTPLSNKTYHRLAEALGTPLTAIPDLAGIPVLEYDYKLHSIDGLRDQLEQIIHG